MNGYKVVLCDDNSESLSKMQVAISALENCMMVKGVNVSSELIECIKYIQPEIVVVDVVMASVDGLEVLNSIHKKYEDIKIIAVSPVKNDKFIEKIYASGADYIFVKPIDMASLVNRVSEICKQLSLADNNQPPYSFKKIGYMSKSIEKSGSVKYYSIDERLSNIFITVGIPAHIKGYQFLREAVKMTIGTPEIINSITKRLYPSVAGQFSTSASKVERAIRHAIEVAWNRGKIENINDIFGIKVYSPQEKPTNGEFIALVADKLLTENVV